jgi:hypothetical protein
LPANVAGGGENDAAIVIGIADYAFLPKVPGADDNAAAWVDYLRDVRKVPFGSIFALPNNGGAREQILDVVQQASKAVKPGGTLWFVYIGHGAPAADAKDGVLVGVDAQQNAKSLYARSVRRSEILSTLTSGGAPVVMILDACFSGKFAQPKHGTEGNPALDVKPLVEDLQPVLPVLEQTLPPTVTILGAARADQFAGPLLGAKRPAFSYLMLGAMRGWADADKDGKVTAREATAYAEIALSKEVGRGQTPTLEGAETTVLAKSAESSPDIGAIVHRILFPPKEATLPAGGELGPRRPVPWTVYVTGAATLGLGIAAGVFGVSALKTNSDYEAANNGARTADANRLRGDVESTNLTADLLAGGAVVMGAATLVLYLLRPEVQPSPAASVGRRLLQGTF